MQNQYSYYASGNPNSKEVAKNATTGIVQSKNWTGGIDWGEVVRKYNIVKHHFQPMAIKV